MWLRWVNERYGNHYKNGLVRGERMAKIWNRAWSLLASFVIDLDFPLFFVPFEAKCWWDVKILQGGDSRFCSEG